MSKLAAANKFLDFSDYGRPFGKLLANSLKNTRFTAIHVTLLFGITGLLALFCILNKLYIEAGILIILKSCIDAGDGELARIKGKPSYVGRYLDSIFDICLNFLFLMAICYVSKTSLWLTLIGFFCIQLQGTLYNYYYLILRHNSVGGDRTSQIFEHKTPIALHGESQKMVNLLFKVYTIVYGGFDKIIHLMDADAHKTTNFPNWFMSILSIYGLGFQLLVIAVFLPTGQIEKVIPFFILSSFFGFLFIGIRKYFFK
jgi:phosphatidylglycerophosphate synthase